MATTAPFDIGSLIESIPGVSGGRPVLAGSGFSITQLAACYNAGWSVDEILSHFPQLDRLHVHAGIAYYLSNRAATDAELERQQAAYDEGNRRQARRSTA
jgi:uncharacterized protein (DUF433 family)